MAGENENKGIMDRVKEVDWVGTLKTVGVVAAKSAFQVAVVVAGIYAYGWIAGGKSETTEAAAPTNPAA